ncbi:MAG: pantetheine-phosphate adenylyltransferase [Oscillospiraceae bacterium]|jgi:pantetheine-phosphate adenylyltransferase|nr:pantetheine-phosphate adenylyltransferase [Oscillospiraceae bacterium]
MKKAIYPGSFDPVTFGHIDIIERAANLFGEVTVLVSNNPDKNTSFSYDERLSFIKKVTMKYPNVKTDMLDGLLVDYFRDHNADVIIKGLRAMSDFEFEFQQALVNKDLFPKAETVFLCANVSGTFLSSSMVKQVAMFGGDISSFVPQDIINDIYRRVKRKA